MKHGTTYIQPEDIHELNRLRLNEYKKTEGFIIKDEAVIWNKSDENAHVLGVWNRGELISSMRLEIISNLKDLEYKIECEIPPELSATSPLEYPVGILSKAVTSAELRSSGLNAHLRYYLLKIAQNLGIKDILGTLVKGAPRSKSLVEMGYNFYSHPTGWNSPYYKSTGSVEIVHLDLQRYGKRALQVCAQIAATPLLLYPHFSAAESEIRP